MAFSGNYVSSSFKAGLLQGLHDFTTGTGHAFKMALYTNLATINASTAAYTTSGEVAAGGGYTTGGEALTISSSIPTLSGSISFLDFADVTWVASNITARGAMIYNSTASGNPSVVILDFGVDKTSIGGDFLVIFPAALTTKAIVRVS